MGIIVSTIRQKSAARCTVDGEAQVIVAAEVTQQSNDKQQLVPMLEQVKQNIGAQPQAASANNGYWNGKQVGDARVQGIDLHVATGTESSAEAIPLQRLSAHLLRAMPGWGLGSLSLAVQKVISRNES